MSGAVSIGEAAARVLQRTMATMAFQSVPSDWPTAESGLRLINAAHGCGALSDAEHVSLLSGVR